MPETMSVTPNQLRCSVRLETLPVKVPGTGGAAVSSTMLSLATAETLFAESWKKTHAYFVPSLIDGSETPSDEAYDAKHGSPGVGVAGGVAELLSITHIFVTVVVASVAVMVSVALALFVYAAPALMTTVPVGATVSTVMVVVAEVLWLPAPSPTRT